MASGEEQTLTLRIAGQQAADWWAKLQREDLSAAQRAEFDRWLQADPAHAVAYARVEYAWERTDRLRALPGLSRHVAHRASGRTWKVAVALAAAAAITASIMRELSPEHVYATSMGERRTVSLQDGSQVNLNTASRIEVDFAHTGRTVRLRSGEALFKVASDPQRPFVVEAGQTRVRVLGTAFNVRLRSQLVEVTVTEGAVAINDDRIPAGSAAVATVGTVNRVSLTQDALRRRVAWRDGIIELRGETLEQAVEEFNRYNERKLVIADPAIATLRIGGRFETNESVKFVNALKANFSIRAVAEQGDNVYLLGPE